MSVVMMVICSGGAIHSLREFELPRCAKRPEKFGQFLKALVAGVMPGSISHGFDLRSSSSPSMSLPCNSIKNRATWMDVLYNAVNKLPLWVDNPSITIDL